MTPGTTEWVHLDELESWDKNPRNIEPAVRPVAASIRRFGFVAPVVVWASKARLVAGHTRTAAMRHILAGEPTFVPRGAPEGTLPGFVPVHFHEFGSEDEATAYGIADNRLNELAEWDRGVLDELLKGLSAPLVDLAGFTLPELPTLDLPPAPGAGGGTPPRLSKDNSKRTGLDLGAARRPDRTYAIALTVESEEHQRALYDHLRTLQLPVAVLEVKVLTA